MKARERVGRQRKGGFKFIYETDEQFLRSEILLLAGTEDPSHLVLIINIIIIYISTRKRRHSNHSG